MFPCRVQELFYQVMLNQNNDNYNSQSKQMKISLAANENSKSEQVNSLKRGKTRVTKPQVEHI